MLTHTTIVNILITGALLSIVWLSVWIADRQNKAYVRKIRGSNKGA